jgi:hypothetical protein
MSAKATEYYTREQDTKGTARMVLFILAEHANEEGYCYPSIATIAKKSLKSERVIQRAMQLLEANGKIGRKIHDGKNTKYGKTNMYFLNDYRVSVGLDPVITFNASKTTSPAISTQKRVTVRAERGDKNDTQNKYTNQNLLNNYKHNSNVQICFGVPNPFKNQNESAMHDQRPTDNQSARDIELPMTEQQPEVISSTTQFENQSARAIELPTVEQQPEVISSNLSSG